MSYTYIINTKMTNILNDKNIDCIMIPHQYYFVIIRNQNHEIWPWSTKAVISNTDIFVAIANNTLYGSKLSIFLLCQKIIRILRSCSMNIFSKFPTVNISKLNFWLVICIAKNFIWTTLKMIFSIFWFFCTLRFQIFK